MSRKIHGITMDEIDGFGVDDENQLYWHEKPIEIKKRISFTFWQSLGAIITVVSAFSMAIFDAIRFLNGQ